jgi:ureidoacrylate peracid hydrolase
MRWDGLIRMKTALLVIDMQNDFVKENSVLEIKEAKKFIHEFEDFIKNCRDKGMTIIYTRHIFDPKMNPIETKLFPKLLNYGLREYSKGSEIIEEIKPKKRDIVIKKRRYDSFFNTRLEKILIEKGISNIIITGLMTNICCESTARTAMMKDFNVLFCSDLTFTSNPELQKATLNNISSHFGMVVSSKNIISNIL